ncbi:hypothetical protein EST38_g365 [Candolleomyces aberdarensis]|uniref:Uncharacterized protein n=1 Tax=Candolleomyces aberdarensis TaxID=2316362 RepID=A0A4Q2E0A0_9AGAR|nr:hypothetical protein EST38_g365 [Candolleomyces aberdarensis]
MVAERTGRAPGSGGFFTVLTDGLRRAYRSSGFSIVPGTEPEPEEPFEEGIQDYLDSLRGRDRYRQPLKEKEQYKPFYTHPAPAEPGFTHDFAPDASSESAPSFPPSSKSAPIVIVDEEDESKPEEETKMSTTLVCARCYDPLVLNAGLTGSEASQRRIWALRCGHLLDGKCVSQIGQPALTVDRKGKGKAKEEIPYGEAPSSRNQREIATDTEEPPAGTTSIRSRLRSRAQSGTQDANSDLLPPSPNSRKRKRGPTKASANKKAKVEDVFEWQCPVPGCGKMHASVKINGGWGPEKERQMKKGSQATVSLADLEMSPRGIIPVFV